MGREHHDRNGTVGLNRGGLNRGGLNRGGANRAAWLSTTALTASLAVAVGTALAPRAAHANPQGGTVAAGSADIQRTSPTRLDINQHSDKVVINWQDFSIGQGEHTNFNQPSSSSIALNRVTSLKVSQIFGTLTANGQIMIINPNGILFGQNAQVDVAGLVATTSDIADDDFMAGEFTFDIPGDADATVVNRGDITIGQAGLAAFVAPGVANNGVIRARLGKVTLASGNKFTIDMYGDGMVQLAVDDRVAAQALGADRAQVENAGQIVAEGGTVVLTASQVEGIVDNVINMDGVIQANTAEQTADGTIVLGGGSGGVDVSGTLEARGDDAGEAGGSVEVTGERVALRDGAKIDVSGQTGGGEAYVGVDKDRTQVAAELTTEAGSTIDASTQDGDGGYVETSGHDVTTHGGVDTSSQTGKGGTWYTDPTDQTIDAATAAAHSATLSQAGGATVTVDTDVGGGDEGDITLESDATVTHSGASASTYNLLANRHIDIEGTIETTGSGSLEVNMTADQDGSGTGTVTTDGPIGTNGGDINIIANDADIAAALDAGSGGISFARATGGVFQVGDDADGDFEIDQDELNNMSAATLTIGGANTDDVLVRDANTTLTSISGLVTFIATQSNGSDVEFAGTNIFAAVRAEANGAVEVENGALVTTRDGDVDFLSHGLQGGTNRIDIFGEIVSAADVLLTGENNPVWIHDTADVVGINVEIEGDDLTVEDGATIAADDTITVRRNTLGAIDLGDGNEGGEGELELSQDEVDAFDANSLVIGESNASAVFVGDIDINGFDALVFNALGASTVEFDGESSFTNLTANANDDIIFRDEAVVVFTGDTLLNADADGDGEGDWVVEDEVSISASSGDVLTVSAADVDIDDDDTEIEVEGSTLRVFRSAVGRIGLGGDTSPTDPITLENPEMHISADEAGTMFGGTLVVGSSASNEEDILVGDLDLSNEFGLVELNAFGPGGADVEFIGDSVFNDLTARADDRVRVRPGGMVTVTDGSAVEWAANFRIELNGDLDGGGSNTTVLFDSDRVNLNADIVALGGNGGNISGTATLVNVESDDAEIQDGVDVAAEGATVNVADGDFDGEIEVYKDDLTLIGDGFAATTTVDSSVFGMLVTGNNADISGFKFDGDVGTDNGIRSGAGILIGDAVDGTSIHDNGFFDLALGIGSPEETPFGGGGFTITEANVGDTTIEDNYFENVDDGIVLAGAGDGGSFHNIVIGNNIERIAVEDVANPGDVFFTTERGGGNVTFLGRLPNGDVILRVNNSTGGGVNRTLQSNAGFSQSIFIPAGQAAIVNVGQAPNLPGNTVYSVAEVGGTATVSDANKDQGFGFVDPATIAMARNEMVGVHDDGIDVAARTVLSTDDSLTAATSGVGIKVEGETVTVHNAFVDGFDEYGIHAEGHDVDVTGSTVTNISGDDLAVGILGLGDGEGSNVNIAGNQVSYVGAVDGEWYAKPFAAIGIAGVGDTVTVLNNDVVGVDGEFVGVGIAAVGNDVSVLGNGAGGPGPVFLASYDGENGGLDGEPGEIGVDGVHGRFVSAGIVGVGGDAAHLVGDLFGFEDYVEGHVGPSDGESSVLIADNAVRNIGQGFDGELILDGEFGLDGEPGLFDGESSLISLGITGVGSNVYIGDNLVEYVDGEALASGILGIGQNVQIGGPGFDGENGIRSVAYDGENGGLYGGPLLSLGGNYVDGVSGRISLGVTGVGADAALAAGQLLLDGEFGGEGFGEVLLDGEFDYGGEGIGELPPSHVAILGNEVMNIGRDGEFHFGGEGHEDEIDFFGGEGFDGEGFGRTDYAFGVNGIGADVLISGNYVEDVSAAHIGSGVLGIGQNVQIGGPGFDGENGVRSVAYDGENGGLYGGPLLSLGGNYVDGVSGRISLGVTGVGADAALAAGALLLDSEFGFGGEGRDGEFAFYGEDYGGEGFGELPPSHVAILGNEVMNIGRDGEFHFGGEDYEGEYGFDGEGFGRTDYALGVNGIGSNVLISGNYVEDVTGAHIGSGILGIGNHVVIGGTGFDGEGNEGENDYLGVTYGGENGGFDGEPLLFLEGNHVHGVTGDVSLGVTGLGTDAALIAGQLLLGGGFGLGGEGPGLPPIGIPGPAFGGQNSNGFPPYLPASTVFIVGNEVDAIGNADGEGIGYPDGEGFDYFDGEPSFVALGITGAGHDVFISGNEVGGEPGFDDEPEIELASLNGWDGENGGINGLFAAGIVGLGDFVQIGASVDGDGFDFGGEEALPPFPNVPGLEGNSVANVNAGFLGAGIAGLGQGLLINGNEVHDIDGEAVAGIFAANFDGEFLGGPAIRSFDGEGYDGENGYSQPFIVMDGDNVGDVSGDGIFVPYGGLLGIFNTSVDGVSHNGITVGNVRSTTIDDTEVSNADNIGILVDTGLGAFGPFALGELVEDQINTVLFNDVTVTDSDTGIELVSNGDNLFENGEEEPEELVALNLNYPFGEPSLVATLFGTEVIGGETGLVIDGPGVRLNAPQGGPFLASLFDTSFAGQTGDFITLRNGTHSLGAGNPIVIDARSVSFDGVTGAGMTQAQFDATELKLTHFPDLDTLGLLLLGFTPPGGGIDSGLVTDTLRQIFRFGADIEGLILGPPNTPSDASFFLRPGDGPDFGLIFNPFGAPFAFGQSLDVAPAAGGDEEGEEDDALTFWSDFWGYQLGIDTAGGGGGDTE